MRLVRLRYDKNGNSSELSRLNPVTETVLCEAASLIQYQTSYIQSLKQCIVIRFEPLHWQFIVVSLGLLEEFDLAWPITDLDTNDNRAELIKGPLS